MEIRSEVFKRHGFTLRDSQWTDGKVWVKDYFFFKFITTNENGHFDDSCVGQFVKPSENPYHLFSILDASEETLVMVRETQEINVKRQCEEYQRYFAEHREEIARRSRFKNLELHYSQKGNKHYEN